MDARSSKPVVNRRDFLASAGTSLAAAAIPSVSWSASDNLPGIEPEPKLRNPRVAAGAKKKIPIGVFDPVYDHLSLDEMLAKVSALGLEAMEIGTGSYPNNRHCALDDLIQDKAKARAWQKKFEDKGIRVATLS